MRFHHGAPFRNAIEDGLLDPRRMVQIGIRGAHNAFGSLGFLRAPRRAGRSSSRSSRRSGVGATVEIAREIVGAGPTYLSFDIDALDPSIAPGTGTPEAGGLTMREAQGLVRGMRGLDLIGADVVEVSPPFDPGTNTALCGATMLMSCCAAGGGARPARREGHVSVQSFLLALLAEGKIGGPIAAGKELGSATRVQKRPCSPAR